MQPTTLTLQKTGCKKGGASQASDPSFGDPPKTAGQKGPDAKLVNHKTESPGGKGGGKPPTPGSFDTHRETQRRAARAGPAQTKWGSSTAMVPTVKLAKRHKWKAHKFIKETGKSTKANIKKFIFKGGKPKDFGVHIRANFGKMPLI